MDIPRAVELAARPPDSMERKVESTDTVFELSQPEQVFLRRLCI